MLLADLDEAVMLRNHRHKAVDLINAAHSGLLNFSITYGGKDYDPFSVIAGQSVRDAVIQACDKFIAETDKELASIGVEVEPTTAPEAA